ncbi:hypothetical protein FGO68_gene7840 [Halteria grandinella]|uniref:Uncharacterized protein n=1 Tax=Halteria grandinella TaxID=5974 RepID=A0A8J8NWY7_HALGN|nr:hypothetical protein FGO68_gene7840 [Halteria grandinella]
MSHIQVILSQMESAPSRIQGGAGQSEQTQILTVNLIPDSTSPLKGIISKYIILEIFSLAFPTSTLFRCFSRLNKTFLSFSSRERDLVERMSVNATPLSHVLSFTTRIRDDLLLQVPALIRNSTFYSTHKSKMSLSFPIEEHILLEMYRNKLAGSKEYLTSQIELEINFSDIYFYHLQGGNQTTSRYIAELIKQIKESLPIDSVINLNFSAFVQLFSLEQQRYSRISPANHIKSLTELLKELSQIQSTIHSASLQTSATLKGYDESKTDSTCLYEMLEIVRRCKSIQIRELEIKDPEVNEVLDVLSTQEIQMGQYMQLHVTPENAEKLASLIMGQHNETQLQLSFKDLESLAILSLMISSSESGSFNYSRIALGMIILVLDNESMIRASIQLILKFKCKVLSLIKFPMPLQFFKIMKTWLPSQYTLHTLCLPITSFEQLRTLIVEALPNSSVKTLELSLNLYNAHKQHIEFARDLRKLGPVGKVSSLTLRNHYKLKHRENTYLNYFRQSIQNILLIFGEQLKQLVVERLSLNNKHIRRLKCLNHLQFVESQNPQNQRNLNFTALISQLDTYSYRRRLQYLRLDMEFKPSWIPIGREIYFSSRDNRDTLAQCLLSLKNLICLELSMSCWGKATMLSFFETLLESQIQCWPKLEFLSFNIAKRGKWCEKNQIMRDTRQGNHTEDNKDRLLSLNEYYERLLNALAESIRLERKAIESINQKQKLQEMLNQRAQCPRLFTFKIYFKVIQWPRGTSYIRAFNGEVNIQKQSIFQDILQMAKYLNKQLIKLNRAQGFQGKVTLSSQFSEKIQNHSSLSCVELIPIVESKWLRN